MKRIIYLITTLLVISCSLSTNSTKNNPFVGLWEGSDSLQVEFKKDGSLTFFNNKIDPFYKAVWGGLYRYDDEYLYIIEETCPWEDRYTYSISDDFLLYIEGEDENICRYRNGLMSLDWTRVYDEE